jgi:hypothetical protein
MKQGDDPSSPPAGQANTENGGAGSSRSLIVEDQETPDSGAMTRSAFLARLHDTSVGAANEALGPTWSAKGCPYMERWFTEHANTPAATLDQMARRYSRLEQPTSASDFLAPIAARIRSGVARWKQSGDVTADFVDAGLSPSEAAQANKAARDALGQRDLVADAGQPGSGANAGTDAAPGASAPPGPEAPAVQAKLAPGQTTFDPGDPAAVATRLGEGEAFGGAAAARMSEAYGENFGDVRLHVDPAAQKMTSDMGALAVTVGSHIAFAPGTYRPETPEGDALLAHELAHVLQQRGAAVPSGQPQAKTGGEFVATDSHEADADAAAADAMVHLYGGRNSPARPSLAGRLRQAVGKMSAQAGVRLRSSFALARCSRNERPSPAGIHYARGEHPSSNPTPETWGREGVTQDESATHDEILDDLAAMNAGSVFVFWGHGNDHAVQAAGDKPGSGGTTGKQMAEAAGRDKNPPTVVVLGACESAGMLQQLSDAGVPIVVGYDSKANSVLLGGAVNKMMTMLQSGETFDKASAAADAILAQQGGLPLQTAEPASTQIVYRTGYDGSMTLSSARAHHRSEVGAP